MNKLKLESCRYYLRLCFEVLLPITNLEFYQGVYWSAMLRDWIRPYFAEDLHELGVYPIPAQNGFRAYYPKEIIALDLSIPEQRFAGIVDMLEDELQGKIKSTFPRDRLHFLPGKSIKLLGYTTLPVADSMDPIDQSYVFQEATNLKTHPQLNLIFHTPLRLKPGSDYKGSYRYMDPIGFDSQVFFSAFCREFSIEPVVLPTITAKGFIWLDVPYKKTLGGLIGGIQIETPVSDELLNALVWGQFFGIGKNRSFGFGFYSILESSFSASKSHKEVQNCFLTSAASLYNSQITEKDFIQTYNAKYCRLSSEAMKN